jgi:methanogenic corrinoid protein MtbC1
MADLIKLLADLEEAAALEVVAHMLDAGEAPQKILADARQGMEILGQRFADGEYFIPDLIYSGEILKRITEIVKPRLKGEAGTERLGKVVLGTVAGDIHDIGLNIVDFMLDTNGFVVYNLGVDVPAWKFVEKIQESSASILGLSGFLTLAFDAMKDTVAVMKEAGLRERVKIMIGGGQINDTICKYTGADAYGQDAMAAVSLAKNWVSNR